MQQSKTTGRCPANAIGEFPGKVIHAASLSCNPASELGVALVREAQVHNPLLYAAFLQRTMLKNEDESCQLNMCQDHASNRVSIGNLICLQRIHLLLRPDKQPVDDLKRLRAASAPELAFNHCIAASAPIGATASSILHPAIDNSQALFFTQTILGQGPGAPNSGRPDRQLCRQFQPSSPGSALVHFLWP